MLWPGADMTHDLKCELNHRTCRQCADLHWAPHCHCGSRAYALCKGCRTGMHTNHATTEPSTGEHCACDLCDQETAA